MGTTDVREVKVLAAFVDVHSNLNYVLDRFFDMGEPMGMGESMKVPEVSDLTVKTSGATRVAGSALSVPGTTSEELKVDQEPWIPLRIPKRDDFQSLRGNFMNGIAESSFTQLKNYIDSIVLDDYLARQLAWTQDGVYHFNEASNTIEPKDLLKARGFALREKGSLLQNFLWILDPLAAAAVMSFTGWREVESSDSIGPQVVGRIYGVAVIETQAVRIGPEVAIATSVIASLVLTMTFVANPGIVVGNLISTDGLDDSNDATAAPVLTVSADGLTITVTTAEGDDADAGTGTLTELSSHNLLVDTKHIYQAQQQIPSTRIMPDPETTGDIMQTWAMLGFIGRAGRARTVHSPYNDI